MCPQRFSRRSVTVAVTRANALRVHQRQIVLNRLHDPRGKNGYAFNRALGYIDLVLSGFRRTASKRGYGIAVRLAVGLAVIFVALGVVSVTCVWALVDTHRRLHAMKADEAKARSVVRLASLVRDQYTHVAHTVIVGSTSFAAPFASASQELVVLAHDIKHQVGVPLPMHEIDGIARASMEIARLFEVEVLPLATSNGGGELGASHDRIALLAIGAKHKADLLVDHVESQLDDLEGHVRVMQHRAVVLAFAALLLTIVMATLVGLYLYRSVARPIATLAAAAERVGAGDLSTEITIEQDDELGHLGRRFNAMTRDLRDHQARLLQSERLAGLGRVAAGIAHELNNPLGVILGYARLLRNKPGGTDARMLAAVEEEAERCRVVVEGLLDLTRGCSPDVRPVSLRALVEDVLARQRITKRLAEVDVEVLGDARAQADSTKLRQALNNLIENAVEAAGDRGRVAVSIATTTGRSIDVDVTDSGPGIPTEARDKIFEPFFTTKTHGTGLGLAISRSIARAHGGDIVVLESDAAAGAVFRLTLPGTREESV